MGTLSLNDPVNGTVADADLIATNNAAIKSVVNGGLDNTNITSGAAIDLSKLSGYPSDATKFARGDGTWAVPSSTGGTNPTPATTLPVSPANLDRAILVDSTSAPTYAWEFQYSSTAVKWLFVGGAPLSATVDASESTGSTTYADCTTSVSVTVPRAGTYKVEHGAVVTAAGNGAAYLGLKVGAASAVDSLSVGTGTVPLGLMKEHGSVNASASDVISQQYHVNASGTQTQQDRWIRVTPVAVT